MTMHRTILTLLLTFLASTAHAWGTQGHQVVANLAYAHAAGKRYSLGSSHRICTQVHAAFVFNLLCCVI